MKDQFRRMKNFASLGAVSILLVGSLSGCELQDAAAEGFFTAITQVVTAVVTDTLLPGD